MQQTTSDFLQRATSVTSDFLQRATSATRFFYENYFYKNHKAQNCQKIKNILRIMARLKYLIKNIENPILIHHQESALFTMECLLFTMEGLQFRKTCVRNQHTNQSKFDDKSEDYIG